MALSFAAEAYERRVVTGLALGPRSRTIRADAGRGGNSGAARDDRTGGRLQRTLSHVRGRQRVVLAHHEVKLAFAVCSRSDAAPSRRAELRETLVARGSDSSAAARRFQLRNAGVTALASRRESTRKLCGRDSADHRTQAA